jgi:excisionase family DNA binding protein
VARRAGATAASVPALPVRLLSVRELAELLQVPVKTIYQWRCQGDGPAPIKVGRHLRFDPGDVALWIEGRKALSAIR